MSRCGWRREMERRDWLAECFDEHREHLRDVAERILGSLREADEAVEEAWVWVSGSEANPTDDLADWLAATVTRICHEKLRRRLGGPPRAVRADCDPHGLLADSLGVALVAVLESMSPAERLAFVLREFFAVPLTETATLVGQPVEVTEELVNRARERLRRALLPS
jgi:RNA polymerase sigma-70 factor, ECF subfamily